MINRYFVYFRLHKIYIKNLRIIFFLIKPQSNVGHTFGGIYVYIFTPLGVLSTCIR